MLIRLLLFDFQVKKIICGLNGHLLAHCFWLGYGNFCWKVVVNYLLKYYSTNKSGINSINKYIKYSQKQDNTKALDVGRIYILIKSFG